MGKSPKRCLSRASCDPLKKEPATHAAKLVIPILKEEATNDVIHPGEFSYGKILRELLYVYGKDQWT